MGRHTAEPVPTDEQSPAPPRGWQIAVVIGMVAAVMAGLAWASCAMLARPNTCGGIEMGNGDRCVVGVRQADRFIPAARSTSPAGTKIGISAAEQSHQRRTYGIVLLIPTVFLAGVLAAVLIRTLRRWRPSRR